MPPFFVYILRCSDGSLYTGYTNDIAKRLVRHGQGRGSKYTRSRLPVVLVYLEKAKSRRKALSREFTIKRLNRKSKLLLCSKYPGKSVNSSR